MTYFCYFKKGVWKHIYWMININDNDYTESIVIQEAQNWKLSSSYALHTVVVSGI